MILRASSDRRRMHYFIRAQIAAAVGDVSQLPKLNGATGIVHTTVVQFLIFVAGRKNGAWTVRGGGYDRLFGNELRIRRRRRFKFRIEFIVGTRRRKGKEDDDDAGVGFVL